MNMDRSAVPAATKEVAAWVSTLRYDDVPQRTREVVRSALLDTIGCGVYGYKTPWARMLLEWARALPGSRWYRVDPGELARRVEAMRSSIVQLPGSRAQARDAADRVAEEVGAAPRIPVLGGVRVRAPALSDELDQVRLGVLAAITAPPVDSARRD